MYISVEILVEVVGGTELPVGKGSVSYSLGTDFSYLGVKKRAVKRTVSLCKFMLVFNLLIFSPHVLLTNRMPSSL